MNDENNDIRAANKLRYYSDDEALQSAFANLTAVTNGERKTKIRMASDDLLVKAIVETADYMGMSVTLTESQQAGIFSSDPVGDIAAASHFRTRKVMLGENWYKEDGGAYLVYIGSGEERRPAAATPISHNKYRLYDPLNDSYSDITKASAEKIEPQAYMFYRSLPSSLVTAKDVLKFAFEGSNKKDWLWVAITGVFGGVFGMLVPQMTEVIFGTAIPEGSREMMVQVGILMVALALTTFAFEITRAFAIQRISGTVERDLQSAVWDRLLSLPVKFFKRYTAGELAQRAMGISRIREILSGTVVNAIISGIFSLFYIIMLFSKGGNLAWIGLIIVVFTMAFSLGIGYLQIKLEKELLEVNNKNSGKIFGWLSGLAKIKIAGAEKRVYENWSQTFLQSRQLRFRKENIGVGSMTFNSVITLMSSMAIFAAMSKVGGGISPGAFIAFITAQGSLLGNSIQMAGTILQINVILPMWKNITPIFEELPEFNEAKADPGEIAGDIELAHINFRYNDSLPLVIKDVSLRIKPGEHVAIVGPSGSGKSTLFRILLGFETPESGSIYFDGKDLKKLDVRLVRKQIGVVLQSGQLLAGSIFENVAGANPDITQEQAKEAILRAGMKDDLAQMPMGMHTVVSEGAGTLSGGQRQRILIARALASNPKILFFDEATSALDNKTQKIVSDSVNALSATRITIAHRLSTIKDCDRIIVLEHGVITETGTYEELMPLGGTFASMARRQIA